MQKNLFSLLILATVLTSGCHSYRTTIWEDTKTVGRYLQRKGTLFWKENADSKMIESAEEFTGPTEDEYIPLQETEIKAPFSEVVIPQPIASPGSIDSDVPGIDQFSKPTAYFAELFKTVTFNTDQHNLKSKECFQIISNIAEYMNKNPNLYIFVEGHCDQRASEDYNLSLGTRRANTIRTLLVKRGVNPNRIYTISFGKEMPADPRNNATAWAKNRRVEFKTFEKI